MQKKRIEFIDTFRAVGILCMIMGHINFGEHFYYYIHAFHMPMFYFVSGYFFHDKELPFAYHIRKKACSLLLPYVVFAGFYFAFDLLRKGITAERICFNLYHFLFQNTDSLPIGGAIWFLTSIFFTELLFLAITRLCKTRLVSILFTVFISTIGCLWIRIFSFRLPWALDTAFAGLFFYLAGHLFKRSEENKKIMFLSKPMVFFPLLLINAVCIFLNGCVNMREGEYAMIPLTWLNASGAILGFWYLCAWIDAHKILQIEKIYQIIKSIGCNSIVYLLTNQIVIWIFNKAMKHIALPWLTEKIIILIFSLILMYGIAHILLTTPLCVLVGKSYQKVVLSEREKNE